MCSKVLLFCAATNRTYPHVKFFILSVLVLSSQSVHTDWFFHCMVLLIRSFLGFRSSCNSMSYSMKVSVSIPNTSSMRGLAEPWRKAHTLPPSIIRVSRHVAKRNCKYTHTPNTHKHTHNQPMGQSSQQVF